MIGLDDKKGHIAALIKLANSDGVITQYESNLIKMIAIRMGISSNDFNEIVINVESINSVPPSTKEEKEVYLYNLFILMKIDLKSDPEEQKMCEELALRLGFGVDEVKRAGEFMTANLSEVTDFASFKKVLNKN